MLGMKFTESLELVLFFFIGRSCQFQFGQQTITTRVFVMTPRGLAGLAPNLDVTSAMDEQASARPLSLTMAAGPDPFADVEIA